MVAQKFITAEPDVTLSVLMFGGFFLWWRGVTKGRVSISLWICIGVLLALSGLTKGPQPLAFFGLGVGAYILIRRRWGDLAGFVLANAIAILATAVWYWLVMVPGDVEGWLRHSRLNEHMTASQWMRDHLDFALSMIIEWAPGSVLLIPALVALARKELADDRDRCWRRCSYATLGARSSWSGQAACDALCDAWRSRAAVIGGILFDRWWRAPLADRNCQYHRNGHLDGPCDPRLGHHPACTGCVSPEQDRCADHRQCQGVRAWSALRSRGHAQHECARLCAGARSQVATG